jgi:hypothetical protein
MCDYSIMAISNRLAIEGEELAAHRFNSGSVGLVARTDLDKWRESQPRSIWAHLKCLFASPAEPSPVVCIPPGAALRLYEIPASLRQRYFIGEEETVRFRQVSPEAGAYRDAITFANGRTILLQRLPEGQRVRVLWLQSQEEQEPEFEVKLAA